LCLHIAASWWSAKGGESISKARNKKKSAHKGKTTYIWDRCEQSQIAWSGKVLRKRARPSASASPSSGRQRYHLYYSHAVHTAARRAYLQQSLCSAGRVKVTCKYSEPSVRRPSAYRLVAIPQESNSPFLIPSATSFHAFRLSNSPCSSAGLTSIGVLSAPAFKNNCPSLLDPLTK
jgi:hypothetical protein